MATTSKRSPKPPSQKSVSSESPESPAEAMETARNYEERPALALPYDGRPPCPYCQCAGQRTLKTWTQPFQGHEQTRWRYNQCRDDANHRWYTWFVL